MGLKGSGPFFQRTMANKVLTGCVTRICEIYIDDVLIHGPTDNEYLGNTRKVLERFREKKVTANPAKTKLGLKEVEYVGYLIFSTGTSFTEEKRLQVLTSHFQKLRKHFYSSLDWRTTSVTMSRI